MDKFIMYARVLKSVEEHNQKIEEYENIVNSDLFYFDIDDLILDGLGVPETESTMTNEGFCRDYIYYELDEMLSTTDWELNVAKYLKHIELEHRPNE